MGSKTERRSCRRRLRGGGWPFILRGVKTNIFYPFWGANRAEYCGKSGFEVTCQDNVSMISMQKINFTILDSTSTPTPTVKVARQDYLGNLCPNSSLKSPVNTSLNFSLFDYTRWTKNVSFYYGCTSTVTAALSKLGYNISGISLECNSEVNVTFLTETQTAKLPDASALDSCRHAVLVPVSAVAADKLDNNQTSTIWDAIFGGFELNVQNDDTGLCNNCVDSGGSCGQDTTNAQFICYCSNLTSTGTCTSGSSSGSSSRSLGWIIGLSAGAFGTIILIAGCIRISRNRDICISRKRILVFFKTDERDEFDIEAFIRNHGSLSPKRYHYSDLKEMTNSFEDQIGKGGYGTVYKGKLPNGLVVAVKILSESKGDGEEFINEVASIGRTSHVNIVTLVGFCYEGEKRALIYECMPNGSLDKFIHYKQGSSDESCRLEWKTLFEIAVGIARGLEYLHRGCNTRILHFDIKPQNILLDKDFCPKISDFGLAKLCMTKESIVSMLGMRGTAGYIAPEVFNRNFGGVSHKSDVYSYGMLVLEMVGARKNLDSEGSHTSEMFPHYIYKDLELENEIICGEITEDESKIARKMILVSLGCIQTSPSDRPSMSKVVEMLEGPLHSLPIPPKPLLFSEEASASMSQPSETG
ncbi:LEAF RUST 10 DISEASE-RESISTANCE LOCUS RECEPTOR-LIKE PROTEIN KINASE-like 2.1 isoform X2 [Rosa chinensis]|uniref:LEAF RUST 10 DISEASE-RESISTANCE LOCUS RECEPTOR-LIKE PROTEIN KINASE-like 2.1 isoform X2 n=1 Tax=Rosa chinensis TaxID=74649 RepID=UPI001AD91630|nr:LEAF RUST 10 DISEASE-RESISTANCE LOCUS RECEPTOR-LIKE PROTEIN KINASE-like 2.1 isoform X2 [Rosa chinensis]